jgi:hypothetical protein
LFQPVKERFWVNSEPLAELNKTVTPVTSAVQWTLKNLDSGSRTGHFRDRPRRNDVGGLLQEALLFTNSFAVTKYTINSGIIEQLKIYNSVDVRIDSIDREFVL